jgi:hypothetical protein
VQGPEFNPQCHQKKRGREERRRRKEGRRGIKALLKPCSAYQECIECIECLWGMGVWAEVDLLVALVPSHPRRRSAFDSWVGFSL